MTTTVKMPEDDFMTMVSNAIMTTALSGRDTQIIYDGIYFNLEDVFCREFIRGYVIPFGEKSMLMPDPDSKEFSQWLGNLLYIHSNKCVEFFEDNKFIFDFTQGDVTVGIPNKTTGSLNNNESGAVAV